MPAKAPNLALAAKLGRLLEYSLLSCMPNVEAQPRQQATKWLGGVGCSALLGGIMRGETVFAMHCSEKHGVYIQRFTAAAVSLGTVLKHNLD